MEIFSFVSKYFSKDLWFFHCRDDTVCLFKLWKGKEKLSLDLLLLECYAIQKPGIIPKSQESLLG